MWDSGITAKSITNRYDAFGRRVARTVKGDETRYVLDLAGGMERILCDVLPSGVITAWYVHGLDLAFKVDVNGGLNCYHADAQGNIRALTGANGTTLIEYAYTPYGRSLGSTNCVRQPALDDQPFLFAGGQGVMMEERGVPGLYFMRARYYSSDAGVFLSTDPVKNIGPTWRPIAYAYANGNPCRYNDPEGEFINLIAAGIGAVVGAAAGAGIDIGVQMLIEHKSWDELDKGRILGAAAAGAIMGFVGGLTMGASLAVQLTAAAVAGGVSTIAGRGTANLTGGQSFFTDLTWQEVALGAAGGAAGAGGGRAVFGPGAKLFGATSKRLTGFQEAFKNSLSKQMLKSEFGNGLGKGLLGGGFSALKSEAYQWGENGPPNQPGPSPSVWHPSSSPVFMGCDCGK